MLSHASIGAILAIAPFISAVSACTGPQVNTATADLIKEFEGFVESPAPDPIDLPTVGYGHLCQETDCAEVPFDFPLTEETATELMLMDLVVSSPVYFKLFMHEIERKKVSKNLSNTLFAKQGFQDTITNVLADPVTLNENQYGALVSWAFNVGPGNVESSSLVERLNAGEDPNVVNAEELPQWVYAGGEVMPGLVRRREAEVALSGTATEVGALPVDC